MSGLDDTEFWNRQNQEHEEWLERDYDIAFGSFAKDFKQFVERNENVGTQKANGSQNQAAIC